jgi:PKD repeat protein
MIINRITANRLASGAVAISLLFGLATAQATTVEKDGDVCTAIRDLPIGGKLWDVEFTDNISMEESYGEQQLGRAEFDVNNSDDAETVVEAVAAALRAEGDCLRVGLTSNSKDSSTTYRVPFDYTEAEPGGTPITIKRVEVATGSGNGQGNWADTDDFDLFDYEDASVCPRLTESSGGGEPPQGNQAPVADAGGPVEGAVGAAIQFDGSGSNDLDGSISSYRWEFGDGTSRKGKKVSNTYSAAGTYNVTLTVTDNGGRPSSDTTQAKIGSSSSPPVADAGGPYEGAVNAKVQFDASRSNDPDGNIASYSWDFGDGASGKGKKPKHAYSSSGKFTATITVVDNSGESDTESTNVEIGQGGKAPEAKAGGPYVGVTDRPVSFNGGRSSGNISSYSWDFGDGTSGKGKAPTKTYDSVGFYTVTLTVTSGNGQTDSDSSTVSITGTTIPGVGQ